MDETPLNIGTETTDTASNERPDRPMFDKPNLQLSDPDPYAFANRIRKLILLACVMAAIAVIPTMARMVSYEIRRGQMQAEVEVATAAMEGIVPTLGGFEQASRMVAHKVAPSVVSIYRPKITRQGTFTEGVGSGFIVDKQGYILTNEHVVRGASQLLIEYGTGEMDQAYVVGTDPQTDLALLKASPVGMDAASWGDSDQLDPGNLVWALGSPFGLERSVTFGIISCKARRTATLKTINAPNEVSVYQEYLQTDVAVNPGNSGGPLVNLSGEVIGVNTAIVGEKYSGVSFAIPSNIAKRIYEELRVKGKVERGYLGILPIELDEKQRRLLGLERGEGVLVQEVVSNSPAARAGLQSGDVILSWNGESFGDPTLLSREIASTDIDSTAKIVIRRLTSGSPKDLTLDVVIRRKPEARIR